jgi:integrase/recombinase XerD
VHIQCVLMPVTGAESWTVIGDDGAVVAPAERYLAYLSALERSPNTVRAYAASLRLWFEFLGQAGVGWADAGRRVSRGSYKPFLHHVTKGRPVPVRPVKLAVTRRVPRTLDAGQVAAIGARAKLREAAVIPVSTPLVRLYSEYMHAEYGDLDCDYVFVNLFGGRVGQPLCYPTVHRLAARISARTGIAFTAHMLRHTHATELIRRGVPIEVVARLLTHRSSTTTSQTYIHLDAADVREALIRAGAWDQAGSPR